MHYENESILVEMAPGRPEPLPVRRGPIEFQPIRTRRWRERAVGLLNRRTEAHLDGPPCHSQSGLPRRSRATIFRNVSGISRRCPRSLDQDHRKKLLGPWRYGREKFGAKTEDMRVLISPTITVARLGAMLQPNYFMFHDSSMTFFY